jgi:nucleotide-binding universal stress UspA family protein
MKYLVPFDFTKSTESALLNCIKLVKHLDEIHVLHVVEDWELKSPSQTKLVKHCHDRLAKYDVNFKVHVVVGQYATKINEFATEWSMDMIILGNHPLDSRQKIIGSDAIKVIKNTNRPFVTFQQEAKLEHIQRIVVPMAIDNQSAEVIDFVVKLAKKTNAQIHLVGRKQKGEDEMKLVDVNLTLAKNKIVSKNVKCVTEVLEVTKAKFAKSLLQYCTLEIIDMIACTYYADTTLPIFESFVQKLIVNEKNIPVMCVNGGLRIDLHEKLFESARG